MATVKLRLLERFVTERKTTAHFRDKNVATLRGRFNSIYKT